MAWWLLALVANLCYAVVLELNRHWQLPALPLTLARSVGVGVVLLPAMFLLPLPQDPKFWWAGVFLGLQLPFTVSLLFRLAAKHNGRVAAMFMPVELVVSLVLWWLWDQSSFIELWDNAWQGALVFIALFIMLAAFTRLRRNDFAWRAMLTTIPVGVVYGVALFIFKLLFGGENALPNSSIIQLLWLSSSVGALTALLVLWRWPAMRGKQVHLPQLAKAGGIIALFYIAAEGLWIWAVSLAANPGYSAALALLVPVGLMAYHRATGVRDEASPQLGLVMVLAALVLVLAVEIL